MGTLILDIVLLTVMASLRIPPTDADLEFQTALQAAGEGVRTTPLGTLELRGRKTPVEAYRVEGVDE